MIIQYRWTATFLTGLFIFLVAGSQCLAGASLESTDARIRGTVSYQERIALPSGAKVRLSLVDAAAPGTTGFLVAEFPISKIPKPFDVSYDPGLLDVRRSYRIKGQITHEGKILFEGGERPLKEPKVLESHDVGALVLKKVKEPAQPHEAHLKGHTWVLLELPTVDLSRLKGAPPRIIFSKHDNSVSGFTGCNRFWGEYALSGEQLQILPPATTRMACVEVMELENRFVSMLQKVARFTFAHDEMILEDANRTPLARFRRDTGMPGT